MKNQLKLLFYMVASVLVGVGCSKHNSGQVLSENDPNVGGWFSDSGSGSDTTPPAVYESVWGPYIMSLSSTFDYGYWPTQRGDQTSVTVTPQAASTNASGNISTIFNWLDSSLTTVCRVNAGGQGVIRKGTQTKETTTTDIPNGGTYPNGIATSSISQSFKCEEIKDNINIRQSYCASVEGNPNAYHLEIPMDGFSRVDFLSRTDGHHEFSLARKTTGYSYFTNIFADPIENVINNYCLINGGNLHVLARYNVQTGYYYKPQTDGSGDKIEPKGEVGFFYSCCVPPPPLS